MTSISEEDHRTIAVEEKGRMVYYRRQMTRRFWDEHWHANDNPRNYALYLEGHLGRGRLAQVLRRWLPRTGKILEAGCGKAQYVVALRARGYDCLGIDSAESTIEKIRRAMPELPVVCGDVCSLPWENRSIAAYLSFGVVEHFIEGPHQALREAHRVLADRGLLIISVPQVFPWRRREISRVIPTNDYSFYQYAFSHDEFAAFLRQAGFALEAQYGYGSEFALRLRWPVFNGLFTSYPRLAAAMGLALDASPLYKKMARMRLYVAHKTA